MHRAYDPAGSRVSPVSAYPRQGVEMDRADPLRWSRGRGEAKGAAPAPLTISPAAAAGREGEGSNSGGSPAGSAEVGSAMRLGSGMGGADEVRKVLQTAPGLRRASSVEAMVRVLRGSIERRADGEVPALLSGGLAWLTEQMLVAFVQYSKLASYSPGELILVSKPQGTPGEHTFHFVLKGNVCVLTNREVTPEAVEVAYDTTQILGEEEAFGFRALGGMPLFSEEVTFIAQDRVETVCIEGSMVERIKRLGTMRETMLKELVVRPKPGERAEVRKALQREDGRPHVREGGERDGRDEVESDLSTPADAQLRAVGDVMASPEQAAQHQMSPFAAAVSPVTALTEAMSHTWELIQEESVHDMISGATRRGANALQVLDGLHDFRVGKALVIQRHWRGYVHRRARHWIGLSRQLERLDEFVGKLSKQRGIVSGAVEDLIDDEKDGKVLVDRSLSDSSKVVLQHERFRQSVYGPQELAGRIRFGRHDVQVTPVAFEGTHGERKRDTVTPPSAQATMPNSIAEATPAQMRAEYSLPPSSPFSGAVNSASMALDSYTTRLTITREFDAGAVPAASSPASAAAVSAPGRPSMERQPVFEPSDPVGKIRYMQEYSQRSLLDLKDEDAKLTGRIAAEREMMRWAKEQITVLQERLDSSATMFEQQRARPKSYELASAIGQVGYNPAKVGDTAPPPGPSVSAQHEQRVLSRDEVSVTNLRRHPRRPATSAGPPEVPLVLHQGASARRHTSLRSPHAQELHHEASTRPS